MLLIGKNNNVIRWKEQMQTIVTEQYGIIGMFFNTNERFVIPKLKIELSESSSEDQTTESESDREIQTTASRSSASEDPDRAAERALRRAAKSKSRRESKRKLRQKSKAKQRDENRSARKKDLKEQYENERTIYPMMWKRMSLGSQSRVREEEEYKVAYDTLDCVLLWALIRRTHLTHIYGVEDPMREVNVQDQEAKYSALRQGEREYISIFKIRFDEQVSANDGVGIPGVSDAKRGLEFLHKLDPTRYRKMLAQMRNDALRSVPDAYPRTLASAYRIASNWTNEDSSKPAGIPAAGAYVTEEVHVTLAKDTVKDTAKGKKGKKKIPAQPVTCFVCGQVGHYARSCPEKKGSTDTALVVTTDDVDEPDEHETDEWGSALVTTLEQCMFSKYDVLLDNEASLNIFSNGDLLTGIRKSSRPVIVSGIQRDSGVAVCHEGDFGDLGKVYLSETAAANVLSFASQVDSGAVIRYDHVRDIFTLKPRHGKRTYEFGRKSIPGSEGRFYSCDWRKVSEDKILVTTVATNMAMFTKREIDQAAKARELLARMGFPSVSQAIAILNSGSNFDVSARDFQIADAIWGKDIASQKGKTGKRSTQSADVSLDAKIVQQLQILSIDIMYIEKVAMLIGVSTPLGLTIATVMNSFDLGKPSRAAVVLTKAIKYFVEVLSSQNFKTSVIMCDGEGAMSNIIPELNSLGIEVDISGAGGHVSRVERRIRVVKERVRAHMSYHLPFTLSTVGIGMCVLYCISRMNYEPYGVREWGPSPRELFVGRKPDGKRDFRCSFGDYAQCTIPNTDNSMKCRTDDCVVMLPTGNRTGTVRMLSLATGKLVNRDQFRILPMPLSVIHRLDELAKKDGRVRG